MGLRKVAAFGVDYCTSVTSIGATLVTAYSSINYIIGIPITIPWPTYTFTPTDCFIIVNFTFKDLGGNLLPAVEVTVNWAA